MVNLADRIAALTGAEDNATLRAIDLDVALLIGGQLEHIKVLVSSFERGEVLKRMNWNGSFFSEIPRFTASLDATLAEIKRREWLYQISNCLGSPGNYRLHFNLMTDEKSKVYAVERADRDEALAALEALVRAVEAGQ